MTTGWLIFECFINFLEMLTSCFFAARLFSKELKKQRDVVGLFLFAAGGAAILTLRGVGVLPIADYVPEILVFSLYAILVCRSKWWSAVLWALINYLLIGIVSILTSSILCIVQDVAIEVIETQNDGRVMACVLIRLMQLLLSMIILAVLKKFSKPTTVRHNEGSLIAVVAGSIVVLTVWWFNKYYITENVIYYFQILLSVLFLVINFGFLLFKEILAKEKFDKKELEAQNQLISMQIRNQSEVNEMYSSIRSLKHDMNNHLHSISGYLQLGEYEKAEAYIQKIVGEVNHIESYRSGNTAVDALIGSKTNIAKRNGIRVNIEAVVPEKLKISDEHLTVVLGNLYDNAIDANLKLESVEARFINIQILFRGNDLMLYFENAAKEENSGKKAFWPTTKKDTFRHGFGIKNIDRIVKLYDGYCERELKDGVFVCRIRIPNEVK